MHERRSRGCGGVAVALMTVVALIAIAIFVAWARGWFSVAVLERDSDRVQVEMTVDKDRVAEDTATVTSEARQLGESASVAAQIRTVEGTLVQISPGPEGMMTVRLADDTETTLQLDSSLQVTDGGKDAGRDDLTVGRDVVVTYRETDGVKRALKVTLGEPIVPVAESPGT